jgi:glycosyltransferase involved in cell wall biosynthesis
MVHEKEPTTTADPSAAPLRILHVLRAPVGGLFRHVVDLAREQAARGHQVGLVTDSSTGGDQAESILRTLAPSLTLGVTRLRMRRLPHFSDLVVAYKVALLLDELQPDVVHGHGAKGGLYARLPLLLPFYPRTQRHILRAYTPHGGSLHFDPDNLTNRSYMWVERMLERVTDLIPFESQYAKNRFVTNVGLTRALALVVPNGIGPEELEPVTPAPDAAEFLYVGELRLCKGVDILIEALAMASERLEFRPRLVLVGSGPDEKTFRALGERLGVSSQLQFRPPMRAREAFSLGRIIVLPSRAESLPYVVLEAVGAEVPIVATNVGGLPEIFGGHADRLVPSDNARALAEAMIAMHTTPSSERARVCREMAERVGARFSLKAMAEGVLQGYRDAAALVRQRTKGDDSTLLQRI